MKIKFTSKTEQARDFLKKHNAEKEFILEESAATMYGCAILDGAVVGVIGLHIGKYADRIKDFFILPEYRNKGIGTELLNSVLQASNKNTITAFCPEQLKKMFIKADFKETRKQNKISFMELHRGGK